MPPEKRGEEMNGSRFRPASTPGYGTWSENPSTISQSANVTLVTPDVTLQENGSLVRRALSVRFSRRNRAEKPSSAVDTAPLHQRCNCVDMICPATAEPIC